MLFPFFRRQKVIGSSDPRAMVAGNYRYPDGSRGDPICVGDTRLKVIIGGNSSGKSSGLIYRNLLTRRGVSNLLLDTRMQGAAVAAPWRCTVDQKQVISNAYGLLTDLPEYIAASIASPARPTMNCFR